MGKCGICGQNTGLLGPRLHKAKSWLCNDCLKKAGGYTNAPLYGTLEEIKDAINKNTRAKEHEISVAVQNGAKYCLDGVRGRKIIIYEDKVVLKVKATVGSFLSGNISDGEKTIYFADCIGIQFKESGIQIGYLQFETAGTIMNNRSNNFFNENSFTWDTTKQSNETMREVADYVKQRIDAYKSEKFNVVNNISSADEIKKYKELFDLGIITQEEFEAKKKQLLNL